MAQTTDQVPLACGKLEISDDNVNWDDISGESQSLEGTEQARMSGEAYTLDGDTAILAAGKREPLELEVTIVYTETDAEAYETVRKLFEEACGGDIYLRWSPRGGDAGEEQLTTGKGIITSFTYPPMDASSGGPIMAGFTMRVGSVTTAIVAS